MSSILNYVDYVVIGVMLAISASVGLFFRFTGGRQKTTKEFLMAGRDMSIGPVAFSLMATYMSAIAVLGQPAETYMYGSQDVMWLVGMPIGGVLAAYAFLPVYFEMGISSVYEYLEKRFGKTTRTIVSFLFMLATIFYIGVVLYAPALAINAVTGLSKWTSVIVLAVVCTFYCSLGGLKAVLWTDLFQAVLMYVVTVAVVVKGSLYLGSFKNTLDLANEGGRLVFFNTSPDVTERYTLWNAVISGIVYSLESFGANQAQVQRLMSVGDPKKAKKALYGSFILIGVFQVFCFWDGAVLYSVFRDCDPMLDPNVNLHSPDQLMPYFIVNWFGNIPGLPGLCIVGILSASLSTISSAVNSLTAVTIEDFIKPFCFCKVLTESWTTFMAKIIAIGYGSLCLLMTFITANFRGVIEASSIMTSMISGPILGVYCLGMFTTTANEPGILLGLLSGFLFCGWMAFGSHLANINIPHLPRSLEGCTVLDNSTFYLTSHPNETTLLKTEVGNIVYGLNTTITDDEERYILPIYKVSYVWFPLIGTLVVLIMGFVASFIIGIWKSNPILGPENYSPLVRKWFFKSSTSSVPEKNCSGVEMDSFELSSPKSCNSLSTKPELVEKKPQNI